MSDAIYIGLLLCGLYVVPVVVSVGITSLLLRNTPAMFRGFEWSVLIVPLIVWYLVLAFTPHWSGKTMSNLIESLILGLLVAAITLVRGYLGRVRPSINHSR